jgi:hypothetical protein
MCKPMLGHLIFSSESDQRYTRLVELTKLLGVDYRRPQMMTEKDPSWSKAWQEVDTLIREADAFIVSSGFILEYATDRLHKRIADDATVIITVDVNDLAILNNFLSPYGIRTTSLKIMSDKWNPSELEFGRAQTTFVDEYLLDQVDLVRVVQPIALTFSHGAVPVLMPPDGTWTVEAGTDLPDWNRPNCPLVAKWAGTKGRVVTLGFSLFHDHYPRWTDGSLLAGIQENEIFASNLLRYATSNSRTELSPAQLAERAETSLVDATLAAVKRTLGDRDWWNEGIPEEIRARCGDTREREKQRFPLQSYLTLLDLKKIIQRHWVIFEPLMTPHKGGRSRDQALSWIDKFNEARKIIAHPLKAHVAGYRLSVSELAAIKDADIKATELMLAVSSSTA